jgi:hypothetical protein
MVLNCVVPERREVKEENQYDAWTPTVMYSKYRTGMFITSLLIALGITQQFSSKDIVNNLKKKLISKPKPIRQHSLSAAPQ